jgi:hypothetical protein
MSRNINRTIIAGIAVLLVLIPNISKAQSIPTTMTGLNITASTDYPIPGQLVKITARSYSADINSSKISWVVNGKTELTGTGANVLEVTAPALGKKTTVTVSAITTDGNTLRGSITINSGSVDMILESDGYVPPFFKGKISPVYQNTVNITAIPHIANSAGVEYDPKTLVYQWKKNDKVMEADSGYGKQSVNITGDIVPRPYVLTVTVTPKDSSTQAIGIISVGVQEPSINFYVDDQLYGPLFNKAVTGNIRIGTEKETAILMVPYGFNKPKKGIGSLTFSWRINGSSRTELDQNESIVLRAPEDTTGSSAVEISIRNSKQILQGARSGFSTIFGNNNANN